MTLFRDTDAGAAFIATGGGRKTSPEVMRAIAYYACYATDNGRLHSASLHWGDRTLDQIMSDEEGA